MARILSIGLIVLTLVFSMPVRSQLDVESCETFTAVETMTSLDDDFLLLLPNGSAIAYLWDFAETASVGILPFSSVVRSWQQQFGNPFTQGAPIRADTFRVPQISADGQYIAYATAYSPRDLSHSLQFVWSIRAELIVASFPWQPHWIHAIGWVDDVHLGFLAQDDGLSIEIVDLQGDTIEQIPLDWLDLEIDPAPWSVSRQSSYFFLWSTFSSGNLLLWYRADVETESRVLAFNIYNQQVFFERRSDDFVSLQGGDLYQNPETGTPAWSSSGAKLAIPLYDGQFNRNLYLIGADGLLEQVTFFFSEDTAWEYSVDYPVWSQDDRWLAFWVSANNRSDLYVLDVDSGELIQTSTNRSFALPLVWSPDGLRLAYWESAENVVNVLDFDDCTTSVIQSTENDRYYDRILGWGTY